MVMAITMEIDRKEMDIARRSSESHHQGKEDPCSWRGEVEGQCQKEGCGDVQGKDRTFQM